MKREQKFMRLIVILIFVFSTNIVLANNSERIELSNYLRELNKIDRLYKKAKASRVEPALYRFKYEHFEKDLERLKSGLEAYLNAPKRAPDVLTEKIEPISGEYY